MKKLNAALTAITLTGPAAALAHGMHAEAPANSLLHLLVHNWPLLLGAAALVGVVELARRYR